MSDASYTIETVLLFAVVNGWDGTIRQMVSSEYLEYIAGSLIL